MTQQPGPTINVRGAVDLSGLARPGTAASPPSGPTASPPSGATAAAPSGPSGTSTASGPGGGFVVDVDEADFDGVLKQSMTVPVVIDLWATWCGPCTQLSPVLEKLAQEYGGRFLLAKVDVDANPRIAQAFQAQSIPMVVALLKGQPVPLFTGAVPEAQARQVIDELLTVAAQNGVEGTLATVEGTEQDPGAETDVVTEPPLPPLHAKAADAFEAGDYAAAAQAFTDALAENPADVEAGAGLAQAQLFQRVNGIPQAVMAGLAEAAAADPGNVDAGMAVADRDLFAGRVEDAFARLVALVRHSSGEERAAVRARLVDLFEVVGTSDPRVAKARAALANALF